MRWIRVKLTQPESFVHPELCPNCLDAPADHEVSLYRNFGIPFLVSSTTEGRWPFCERCAKGFRLSRRWQWYIGLGPGILLMGTALLFAVINANRNSPALPVLVLFWVGFAFGVFGTLAAKLWHRLKPIPPGCLSNHPTIKPIATEQTLLGKVKSAEYSFAHPIYVEQIVALNPPSVVQVNAKKLKQAIERFESRHAND